jgi:hypothetical protein
MRDSQGRLELLFSGVTNPNNVKYRSKGERVIAEVLLDKRINFVHEPRIYVEEKKEDDSVKGRLWYPDFLLRDQSIVIEYAGRPEDKKYMEGIEHKVKTYREMGLKVAVISQDDIFYKDGPYNRLREDYYVRIMAAIKNAMDRKPGAKVREAEIKAETTDYVQDPRVRRVA